MRHRRFSVYSFIKELKKEKSLTVPLGIATERYAVQERTIAAVGVRSVLIPGADDDTRDLLRDAGGMFRREIERARDDQRRGRNFLDYLCVGNGMTNLRWSPPQPVALELGRFDPLAVALRLWNAHVLSRLPEQPDGYEVVTVQFTL